jgi:hypothetical protein
MENTGTKAPVEANVRTLTRQAECTRGMQLCLPLTMAAKNAKTTSNLSHPSANLQIEISETVTRAQRGENGRPQYKHQPDKLGAGVAIPEEVFERDAVVGWRRKLGGGRRWDSALYAAAAAAAAATIS